MDEEKWSAGERLCEAIFGWPQRLKDEGAFWNLMDSFPEAVPDSNYYKAINKRLLKVLELRFGRGQERGRTLEEVGRIFGVTRERIRQLEAAGLRKLRRRKYARRIKQCFTDQQ
ncbi:hypothetical protein LCGC14_1019810 [marine sediment metagenome]|uniref:RNA polymerase sigma-70 domain-containing protein n=1 Tax=marine sediment metagenome TaxID=412755 RepID=A0A0F9MXR4_9ZZZZ